MQKKCLAGFSLRQAAVLLEYPLLCMQSNILKIACCCVEESSNSWGKCKTTK